jgi:hypothetical protein
MGGVKSMVPFVGTPLGTGGTLDARYCYAVWLRHLIMISRAGLSPIRESIVELGPGDSIGTGLATLLTTAQRYVALDVVPHAAEFVQTRLLEALAEMLRSRADIPDGRVFPELLPRLSEHEFPSDLLTPAMIESGLGPERLRALRQAVGHMAADDRASPIRYACPWSVQSVAAGSADLVFSQAVLQEIDNRGAGGALQRTFPAMAAWLKPGGVMSHQIDLGMYGSEPWDSHWKYHDAVWAIIRGRRANYVNREPLSTYERLCSDFGFEIVLRDVVRADSVTPTEKLARRYRLLSERDRTARAVHIVAVKRG